MEGGLSRHVHLAKYKSKYLKVLFLIQMIDLVIIKEPRMLYVTTIFKVKVESLFSVLLACKYIML